jgi:integral membrane sensor domain MASE1
MSSINNKQQQLGRGLRNAGKIIVLFALPFAVYMINRGENVAAILMLSFFVILLPGCALYVAGDRVTKKAEQQQRQGEKEQQERLVGERND